MAKVTAINIIEKKGYPKRSLKEAEFIEDFGLKDDVHAGKGDRQVCFFGEESHSKMKTTGFEGLCVSRFSENITTSGIDLFTLATGARFQIGEVEFEISRIGKDCYKECEISHKQLECALLNESVFAKVIKGGILKKGDSIKIISRN